MVGEVLGNFRLTEEIGAGGFGRVYRAEHIDLGLVRAIKIATDREFVRQLRREGEVLARLRHPRIVEVFDMNTSHDPPYIVMEYVEGGDLRQLLERGPLPVARAVEIMLDVLEALEHAHSQGVVHRDIKPANILLDKEGRAKVSDFGLGRVVEEVSRSGGRVGSARSGSGDGAGTLKYMSPEQRRGETPDRRSDLYSLGLVLYEMLTGEEAAGAFEMPSALREDVSPNLDGVLRGLLAPRPENRYGRAEEAHAAFSSVGGPTASCQAATIAMPPAAQPNESTAVSTPQIVWVVRAAPKRPEEWPLARANAVFSYEERGVVIDIPLQDAVFVRYDLGETLLANGHRVSATPLVDARLTRERVWEEEVAGYRVERREEESVTLALGSSVVGVAFSASGLTQLQQDTSPKPDARSGEVWISPVDNRPMVFVPAGEFLRGNSVGEDDSDEGRQRSLYRRLSVRLKDAWDGSGREHPQRRVYLDAYWIDKMPVTVWEYGQFCRATGRQMPPAPSWGWRDNHPVVNVTWAEASDYAAWAGKRLPTEAEWEKAARGTGGRKYPWGNKWDRRKCARNQHSTEPTGSYPAVESPYGALDTAGNVREWCADWYDANYYQSAPSSNPPGPTSGAVKVLRGGSWAHGFPPDLRCARRDFDNPGNRSVNNGFRCVRGPL